jgi:hypothetical protein
MNENPFFQNDRGKVPNIAKTIKGLSMMYTYLLDTPLVMSSSGPREKPLLTMEAPYFQGEPVKFMRKFKDAKASNKDFCFFIVANSFKTAFTSHAMVGWWKRDTLILFDPNGDFYTPDPESVYNGYGYFLAPKKPNIKNPLYNTLLSYFDLPVMKVYNGAPIPCPVGVEGTCIYRAFMYMLSISKSNDPNKVIKYTSKMAKTNIKQVKEIANSGLIYYDFQVNVFLEDGNNLLKNITMNNINGNFYI